MCNQRTHYNYQALDKLLTESSNPLELGDQLDEIMNALVSQVAHDHRENLEEHYHVLRTLRNILWKLSEA